MQANRKLAVMALVLSIGGAAKAATIIDLSDSFTGTSVNLTKWTETNQGLENTGPAGYNAPSESSSGLLLGGTTNNQYWYGSSLESVDKFSSTGVENVSVDRISLNGSGTAYRSSLWLYGSGGDFIHFAQDVGEKGWEVNCAGCGTYATPTNEGTAIAAFNTGPFDTQGNHVMMLAFGPGVGSDVKIGVYLDGTLGATVDFPNWGTNSSTYQAILTGQARFGGDTVGALFQNFVAVPEPSSFVLGALGLAGTFWVVRRRRG